MIIWDKSALDTYNLYVLRIIESSIGRSISKNKCRGFVAELLGYESHGKLCSDLKNHPVRVFHKEQMFQETIKRFEATHKVTLDSISCSILRSTLDTTLPELIPLPQEFNGSRLNFSLKAMAEYIQKNKAINDLHFQVDTKQFEGFLSFEFFDELYDWDLDEAVEKAVVFSFNKAHPDLVPEENSSPAEKEEYCFAIEKHRASNKKLFDEYLLYLEQNRTNIDGYLSEGAICSFDILDLDEVPTRGLRLFDTEILCCWRFESLTRIYPEDNPGLSAGDRYAVFGAYSLKDNRWRLIGESSSEIVTFSQCEGPNTVYIAMDAESMHLCDAYKALRHHINPKNSGSNSFENWFYEQLYSGANNLILHSYSQVYSDSNKDLIKAWMASTLCTYQKTSILSENFDEEANCDITFNGDMIPRPSQCLISMSKVEGPKPLSNIVPEFDFYNLDKIPDEEREPQTEETKLIKERQQKESNQIALILQAKYQLEHISYDPWSYPIT